MASFGQRFAVLSIVLEANQAEPHSISIRLRKIASPTSLSQLFPASASGKPAMLLRFLGLIAAVLSPVDATSTQNALVLIAPARNAARMLHGPPLASAVDTRLVLAQRLGLSRYHSIAEGSDSAVDILNAYAQSTPSIFQDAADAPSRKAVVVIEAVQDFNSKAHLIKWCGFVINPTRSFSRLEAQVFIRLFRDATSSFASRHGTTTQRLVKSKRMAYRGHQHLLPPPGTTSARSPMVFRKPHARACSSSGGKHFLPYRPAALPFSKS